MTVLILRSTLIIMAVLVSYAPNEGLAQSDRDQYEYIDISNPFLRKIPLAVPLFKNESGTTDEKRLSNTSTDLLASSLVAGGGAETDVDSGS